MRKRRIILILIGVVVAGAVVVLCSREREPSYGGKRLSEWVEKIEWRSFSIDGPPMFTPKEAADAVREIGTNGLPYLLAWMDYKQPAWKMKFQMMMKRRFHVNVPDHKAERATRARMALLSLGEVAEPAVPVLASWMLDAQSGKAAQEAAWTLGLLGQHLLSADLALMTNTPNHPVGRILAIQNAGNMGTNARPAVPLLLGLLENPDATVRGYARNALQAIDPETLEKALATGVGKAERKSE